MTSDKIVNYYLLCTISNGSKRHMVDEIPEKKLTVFFTKKVVDLYLRKKNGYYIARETVVGGGESAGPIIVL